MMKSSYEVVLIFSVSKGEEATAALVEKFKNLIAENATVENVDRITNITDGVLRSMIIKK